MPRTLPRPAPALLWLAVALLGAASFATVALARGEPVNAAWLVTAAVSTYLVAYRFYGRAIARAEYATDPDYARNVKATSTTQRLAELDRA